MWGTLRSYLLGVMIIGFFDALSIGLALVLIGVPLVLPLTVLTFFGAFFPLVGAVVAGALAALVALVSGGVGDALLVVGATVAVQQLEGNLLQPLVMGHQVDLHPVVTLVAVSAGAALAGVPGAFLAVPLVAVTRVIVHYASPRVAAASDPDCEAPPARTVTGGQRAPP